MIMPLAEEYFCLLKMCSAKRLLRRVGAVSAVNIHAGLARGDSHETIRLPAIGSPVGLLCLPLECDV